MVDIHKIIDEYLIEQENPPSDGKLIGRVTPTISWRAWEKGDPWSAGESGMWSTDGGETWSEDPPEDPPEGEDTTDPPGTPGPTDSISSARDWLTGGGDNPNDSISDILDNDGANEGSEGEGTDEGDGTAVNPNTGLIGGFVDYYLGIKDKLSGFPGIPEISQQGNIETPDGGLTHIWNEDPWVVPGLGNPLGPRPLPKEDPTK